MIFKAFFYKIEIEVFGKVVHEDFANYDNEILELRQYYAKKYPSYCISVIPCPSVKKTTKKFQ